MNQATTIARLRQLRRQDRSQKPRTKKIEISNWEFLFLFAVAITSDFLNMILTVLFGAGLILNRLVAILTALIIYTWYIIRLKQLPKKKSTNRLLRKFLQRSLLSFLIELIPLLGTIITTWTIFVYLTWRDLKK